jgi:hypothetical protein
MSKMGLHDSFEYLKRKLWAKERLRIKLPIWLLTMKSRESPWFNYMQVACDIVMESFQPGLQFLFKHNLN